MAARQLDEERDSIVWQRQRAVHADGQAVEGIAHRRDETKAAEK